MHSGMLYNCADEKLLSEQMGYLDKLYEFNHTHPTELKKRTELLKKLEQKFSKKVEMRTVFCRPHLCCITKTTR